MRRTLKASSAGSNSGQGASSSALALAFALFATSLAAALGLAPASALGATAHLYQSSFGPDCTSSSQFGSPGAVGVDSQSHDIYVADQETGTLTRCTAGGAPAEFTAGPGTGTNQIPGFSFFPEEALNQIAVNATSHDFYVAASGSNSIKAFHQNGEEAEFSATSSNELTGFGLLCGVAVDTNGDIYAGDIAGEVTVFAPSGAEITSFSAPEVCNIAVDSTGAVYAAPYAFSGLPVEKFTPSEFPVSATTTYTDAGGVDPNRAFGLAVDSSSDELYVDERSRIVQFEADGTEVGAFAETGPGALTKSEGIAIDSANGNVYASDIAGEHKVAIFAPPPPNPPAVEAVSVTNVTTTSADLSARVNPEFFKTTYRFEYLSEAEYLAGGETFAGAQSTADSQLGSTGTSQGAHAHISGLTPDTTYLFRVATENENNEGAPVFAGGEFTTFMVTAPGLPDGRAYEMVSPAQKSGEVIPPEPVSNLGGSCTECLPGVVNTVMPMQSAPDGESVLYEGQPFSGGLAAGPNEYLSGRSAAGWGTQSLSAPTTTGAYVAFSEDLSHGVIRQREPALSPGAPHNEAGRSYPNLYLREADGSFRPLVTKAPPNRTPFGFEVVYAGANPGAAATQPFSHLLLEANDALTAAVPGIAPAAPEIVAGNPARAKCSNGGAEESESCNLYEWVGGQLHLVNVLPGNTAAGGGAVIGSGRLLAERPSFEAPNIDQAISADGSRIFWSSEETGQVYARIDAAKTFEVAGPGTCKESLPLAERACFLTASADGSEVLLSNGQIYRIDEAAETYEPSSDLSEGQGGFQGILGAAEDLSHIYFVDTEALTEESEENANEEHAEAGAFNLYAWQGGTTSFVGVLLESDRNAVGQNGRYGAWKAVASSRLAQVSADGTRLAFTSGAALTGYDNAPSGGGECIQNRPACFEVFAYDANSSTLSCASCNPTGQRPLGPSNLSLLRPDSPFPQPDNLSGDGRIFFESQDALSPRDTNGHIQDVYEWEPSGTKTNGALTCQHPEGCVSLISSGHGANDSMFLDSTPSGDDAFFITRERLVARDQDSQLDLYDARVGGGIEDAGPLGCSEEACKGALTSPPALPGAGSAQFSGPGNPPRQHKKQKHHKKQKQKHHKKHKHQKRSAKHNRGGSK